MYVLAFLFVSFSINTVVYLISLYSVLYRFVLQKLKLSNQIIAIVSIIMTFVGALLIGDWQAIPHDPCTDYSPYHHPELIDTISNHSSVQHSMNESVNLTPNSKISIHSVA